MINGSGAYFMPTALSRHFRAEWLDGAADIASAGFVSFTEGNEAEISVFAAARLGGRRLIMHSSTASTFLDKAMDITFVTPVYSVIKHKSSKIEMALAPHVGEIGCQTA